MHILVVLAHPDDEIGCAGLLKRLRDAGHIILPVIGTSARKGKMYQGKLESEVREEEARLSFNHLGTGPLFCGIGTGGLAHEAGRLAIAVKAVIEAYSPEAVFTLWPVDVHPDHCALHNVTREFCLAKDVNTEYFHFEVCAGTTSPYPQTMKFIPTHYVDIASVIKEKKDMLFSHKSQMSQNNGALWTMNELLWKKRVLDLRGPLWQERTQTAWYHNTSHAEAYVRITREGPLHPELAKFMIPSPHLDLIESLYGGEYICKQM